MAYIGKTPTIGNFQKCDAISTVNGQAAYTMQVGGTNVSPESENHMLVSLNGILQAPVDSFTVSGSTITFASNLATGDVIDFIMLLGNVLDLGVPSDNTVSLAKLTATGTKDATTFLRGDNTFATISSGLSMADQWRLTSNLTGTDGTISSNLEQVDGTGQGTLGTAMSVSSGIFTFPSTGIYYITFNGVGGNESTKDNISVQIQATTNNSSYSTIAESGDSSSGASQSQVASLNTSTLLDVTDTSNVKVKFVTSSFSSGSYLNGNTGKNFTSFTFIRLGDT